jgi:hypothetical protein
MPKPISTFESASLSVCTMQVKRLTDDKQEEIKDYTLVMDFNAIAKAQEQLGRDLSDITKWQDLSGPEITTVVWCALDRFHFDVTLKEVRQMLTPAQSAVVCNMLLEMCFPGIIERIDARLKELKEEELKKAEGPTQTADPTSAGKS